MDEISPNNSSKVEKKQTWLLAGIAAMLFVPLFVKGGLGWFDFWWWMASNAVLLLAVIASIDPRWRAAVASDLRERLWYKLVVGLISAAILYGVFFIGNLLSTRLFDFASGDIDAVYAFKDGVSPIKCALLIGLLIGPAEELFWRAFLQHRLQDHYGRWCGMIIATVIYASVHIGSGNPMLVAAAAICGAYWSLLYTRYKSPLLNVVSHVVWDLAVFLWIPFN